MTTRFSQAALAAAFALLAAFGAHAADDTNSTSAASKKMSDLFPDTVVARGKGVEVKRSQIEDEMLAYRASLSTRKQAFPESQRAMIESNMVDKLVVGQILLNRSTPADKAAAREKVDKLIAQEKTNSASEEVFIQEVKAATGGMSIDQYRNRLADQASEEMVVDRELRSTIKVSDADARKFYDENPAAAEQPEMVRASHILISTLDPVTKQQIPPDKKKDKEDLIRKIRARAVAGEDFGKLAKQYSEDPGSKDKGGEYTFPRGQMVHEFETAAFSMQTNQISDVVETQFGYHIIKLNEKIPAKKVAFDEIAPRVKTYLAEQEFRKSLTPYFDKLKTEAKVEILGLDSTAKPAAPPSPAPGPENKK